VVISVITFVIYKQLSVALSRLFPDGKSKKAERVSGIFSTLGEEQTSEIAKKLASTLKGGEIILLNGELGAGKTVFVRALSSYLGAEESVVSPTFTLMNEYNGEKFRVVHIDAYRLSSGREAYEAGLTEEFGEKNTVCCIEWADNIKDAIVGNTITINIKYTGENQREIEIK
jgi:tRNA threonylcarbamoyladenosine biosynthesis protein TsaE